MTVKVKICGITTIRDASVAVRAGADALGFNFYEGSPRYVTPTAARSITDRLPANVIKVGVFVNADIGSIIETIQTVTLDSIQLHGDESIEFVDELRRQVGCELIKAFRVTPSFNPRAVTDYHADGILLDGYSTKARGGTGEMFDWEVANRVSKLTERLWLAGGLTPENVGAAISQVGPYAIDACSSLESSPGIKDAARVRKFIEEVKRA